MTDIFTPPIQPSSGSTRTHKPRIRQANFGDGYTLRAGDGLNADLESWSLTWSVLTPPQADAIEDFLIAQKGYLAFWWTPPRETEPKKFTCATWDRREETGADSITATFQQVCDP